MNTFYYKNSKKICKGEIYWYNDSWIENGKLIRKKRPIFIISNNNFDITYITITTKMKREYMLAGVLIDSEFGLREKSLVRCNKIKTAPKNEIGGYIGTVSKEVVEKIDRAIINLFGLNVA